MTRWADLAKDNRLAAYEVFEKQRWRTFVSRAYYAAYSATTEALVQHGVTMPMGRSGPSHAKLPELAGTNLTGIGYSLRWRLSGAIGKLYELRIMADYMPDVLVEENEARVAQGLMKQVFDCLGGKS
ncbi:MAG: HEPN domain-containing protein [Candidatus Sumerlaeota bacterium]|nr:HEPN domain-containing protein [Candidatus Sumerlaeota bacterium]